MSVAVVKWSTRTETHHEYPAESLEDAVTFAARRALADALSESGAARRVRIVTGAQTWHVTVGRSDP